MSLSYLSAKLYSVSLLEKLQMIVFLTFEFTFTQNFVHHMVFFIYWVLIGASAVAM